jgi:DNA-binding CsgD family transcriptional regulator
MNHSHAVSMQQARAVATVATEAVRRDDAPGRVRRALGAVADVTGCDAVVLAAWDPVRREHRPIERWGYVADDLADGDGDIARDAGYQLARRTRSPLRLSDVRRRRPAMEGVLALHRFEEGLTHCLFTADGRYTGVLSLNTVESAPYDEARLAAIVLAAPFLAEIVDVTASLRSAAAALPPGMPAVVLHRDGGITELGDRPVSALLLPGAPLLGRARERAPIGPGVTGFLIDDPAGRLAQVVVVRPGDPGADGALLVGVAPATPILSRRELQVVTLIAEGFTNPEIADRLQVSRHTVATHLGHILERLGAPTRGAAAARAVAEGLLLDP